jgi:hypothetical protein
VTKPSLIVALLVTSIAAAQLPGGPVWDGQSLPITIEVLTDVQVRTSERRADGSYGQQRGVLYSSTAFLIGKGQRLRMVEMLGEGACRIELDGARHMLNSCPWLPGFTDNQADIYKIVEFQNR